MKGNLEDPQERDEAAVRWIQDELPFVLEELKAKLADTYELEENDIHFAFLTKMETHENASLAEGIQFFCSEIQSHRAEDFEPATNVRLVKEIRKDHLIWGTQIAISIDVEAWGRDDLFDLFTIWEASIESCRTPLEAQFTEDQKESIIQSILENINKDYHLSYGH